VTDELDSTEQDSMQGETVSLSRRDLRESSAEVAAYGVAIAQVADGAADIGAAEALQATAEAVEATADEAAG
jgi:hypothetical protein